VAYFCVVLLQCFAVLWYLTSRWPVVVPRRLGALSLQVGTGLGGALLVLAWAFPRMWPADSGVTVARLFVGAAVAFLAYFTLLWATGNREAHAVTHGIARHASRWGARGSDTP
jgi:hypothetical protein